MAVISVNEKHDRRRSSYRDGRKVHVRVFLVTTDDINDGTAVAMSADDGTTRVPHYGQSYPGEPGMTVASIEADPWQGSGTHFEVVVEYTSGEFIGPPGNPLDRPPEITWGNTEATAPYFIDRSNPPKPVVNSAGDPFDQFLEREEGEMVITITINEETHDAADADTYSHTINPGPVLIDATTFAAKTLKLSPIQATKVTERVEENGAVQTFTYYRRTYTLKARRQGWDDKPLDVGTNEKVGDLANGFKLRPIVDGTNLPVKRPYPLNGEGRRKPNPTDTPAELEFRPYELKDWAGLKFTDPQIWQEAA